MNYDKVKDQFGDWAPKFKDFIESKAFDDIFKFLKEESMEGKIICPASKDVFRTFKSTPYSKLKAIFILQDPYPWIKNGKMVADGIPMSCSNTGSLQPSLELFYGGIEDDLGIKVPRQPDLSYLSNQGVLLYNSSLTVEMNKPTSHAGIWDPFTKYMIEEVINFYNTGLCYVAFGKQAQPVSKLVIPFLHWGFEVEHPAFAARKERPWLHQNVFSKINKVTKENNNERINWALGGDDQSTTDGVHQLDGEGIRVTPSGVRGRVRAD